MLPLSGRQVRLAAHDQELVAVEVGGGLRTYRAGADDILDGYGEEEACSGGRGQLLLPWPNRLAGGRFSFAGRSFQAPLDEPERGNAIHGLVRWANWAVPDATPQPWGPQTPPDAIAVTYRLHPRPGWGWVLDVRVTYRLVDGRGLEVRTAVTNRSDQPCPVGWGWHPYLRTEVDRTRLCVPAATTYSTDDRGIPVGRRPVAGEADFRTGRLIGPTRLDRAYTDLARDARGRATVEVERPDGRRLWLWMDEGYTHLMVFTGDTLADPGRRRAGLALEPMTAAPDMLNSGDGLVVLEPGRTWEAAWGLDPYVESSAG
jgi:aldose 1-epimerase